MEQTEVEQLAEKAITVDAWFAQPKHSPRKNGDDVFILEYHVSAADWWQHFQGHPRNAHVKLTTWIVEDEEAVRHEAEKKAKPEKGPHGQFWRALWRAGFYNCAGVREAIDAVLAGVTFTIDVSVEDRALVGLRRIFDTASLTMISPEQVERRFPDGNAPSMIRNAIEAARPKQEQPSQ